MDGSKKQKWRVENEFTFTYIIHANSLERPSMDHPICMEGCCATFFLTSSTNKVKKSLEKDLEFNKYTLRKDFWGLYPTKLS